LPCITATVYKQPWGIAYLTTGAPPNYYVYQIYPPPGLMPIPAFHVVAENTPMNVVCFDDCETNLLWPFVINYGGWDTDIGISNTTLDPLAYLGANPPVIEGVQYDYDSLLIAGSATPQAAPCTLFYFSGGVTPWASGPWSTGTILPGSTWTQDLAGAKVVPAFTIGYLWAKCYFSEAYGYGAILYNFGLTNATLSNYLAINVPNPEFSPRDQNGNGMGENSDTPFNIERDLAKELSGLYGHHCCF